MNQDQINIAQQTIANAYVTSCKMCGVARMLEESNLPGIEETIAACFEMAQANDGVARKLTRKLLRDEGIQYHRKTSEVGIFGGAGTVKKMAPELYN